MNEVIEAIVNYKYPTKTLNKQAFICRRSRNNRIQNKVLARLLVAYLEENPVKIIGEVSLVEGKYFAELKRIEADLTRKVAELNESIRD